METVGTILKTEREKQRKSLENIARNFNINIEYLKAIEDDKYHLLPGEVFVKAYLRVYADALELENDYILDLLKNQTAPQPPDEPISSHKTSVFNYKSVLIISSFLLFVILIIFTVQRNERKPVKEIVNEVASTEISRQKPVEETIAEDVGPEITEQKPAEETVAENVGLEIAEQKPAEETVAEDVGPEITEQKPVEKTVNEVRGPEIAEDEESAKNILKVTATELTWVSVSIDGGKSKEWLLRVGEEIKLTAFEKFVIKTGNAGGTRIIFNDKDLGELGSYGKIAEIALP
jgi:cytoskeletal protein RodZ